MSRQERIAVIAAAVEKTIQKRTERQPSVEDYIHQCLTAADEAFDEVLPTCAKGDEREADGAAEVAFRMNMPPLSNRTNILGYIACIAVGLSHRYIGIDEAKRLVYVAQTALMATRKRQQRRG